MNFSKTIKNLRILLKMSQEEFARELDVSFATINRWENGKCSPSRLAISALKELCIKNNLNYEDLDK